MTQIFLYLYSFLELIWNCTCNPLDGLLLAELFMCQKEVYFPDCWKLSYIQSSPFDVCDCMCTHQHMRHQYPIAPTISFYHTYILGHWNKKNERTKASNSESDKIS